MAVLGCPREGVAVTLSGYRAQDGGSARQLEWRACRRAAVAGQKLR
jgi:hypothetical protein